LNYKQGRCKAKDTRVLYIDNWIKQIVVSDFLSQKDISERTKDINRQISEERQRVQQDIKEIKQKMIIIESLLSDKAKQLVSNNFSIFALEDAEETKKEMAKLKRELRDKERRLELMKRITVERLANVIRKFKKRWREFENPDDLGKFLYDMLSRVVITNEIIRA